MPTTTTITTTASVAVQRPHSPEQGSTSRHEEEVGGKSSSSCNHNHHDDDDDDETDIVSPLIFNSLDEWWNNLDIERMTTTTTLPLQLPTTTVTTTRTCNVSDNHNNDVQSRRLLLLHVVRNNNNNKNCCLSLLSQRRRRVLLRRRRHDDDDDDDNRTSAIELQMDCIEIPLESLRERCYELPPRHVPMGILFSSSNDEETWNQIQTLLLGVSKNDTDTISTTTRKKERRFSRQKPWNVPFVIQLSDNNTTTTTTTMMISNWWSSRLLMECNSNATFHALPRLWSPDPMLESTLLPILKQQLVHSPKEEKSFEIWDLGAGAGRDVCFVAEEMLEYYYDCLQQQQQQQQTDHNTTTTNNPNFCVVALDQRYRDPVHDEVNSFWKRRNVAQVTQCRYFQFETTTNNNNNNNNTNTKNHTMPNTTTTTTTTTAQQLIQQLENNPNHVICMFAVRFWNKLLFQQLVQHSQTTKHPLKNNWPRHGTIVAISQFAKPTIGAPWNFAHPKEKNVLERNELRELFCPKNDNDNDNDNNATTTSIGYWKILRDEIVLDNDHGRTLIQFVVQWTNPNDRVL